MEKKKSYFNTIKYQKNLGWKSTCENIDSCITHSELWKIVMKFRSMNVPKPTTIPLTCIEQFCVNTIGSIGPINDSVSTSLYPIVEFSFSELEMAISTSWIGWLQKLTFKCLESDVMKRLLKIYKYIWRTEKIPTGIYEKTEQLPIRLSAWQFNVGKAITLGLSHVWLRRM